jgi:hypothetical protein
LVIGISVIGDYLEIGIWNLGFANIGAYLEFGT